MKNLLIITFIFLPLVYINAQNSISSRVQATGGRPINITEAPYQVSIHYNGSHWCGGSIINNRYILTAAHCMFDLQGNRIPKSSFNVNAGFALQNNPGSHRQSFNVSKIVTHPNYNSVTLDYDVAVIEINGTFSFNNYVKPLELISERTSAVDSINAQVQVSGWGWTTPGIKSPSNELRSVTVPVITNQDASRQLGIRLTARMIATGAVSNNRRGACHEDSGGHLVFQRAGHPDIQIGIVSWGKRKCTGGINSPSIYARVSALKSWIDSQVWDFIKIEGSTDICSGRTYTYSLSNLNPGMSVSSWQVSRGLSITSRNGNRVSVSVNNSSGWVRANLNYNGLSLVRQKHLDGASGLLGGRFLREQGTGIVASGCLKTGWNYFTVDIPDEVTTWHFSATHATTNRAGNTIGVSPHAGASTVRVGIRAVNSCGDYGSWRFFDYSVCGRSPTPSRRPQGGSSSSGSSSTSPPLIDLANQYHPQTTYIFMQEGRIVFSGKQQALGNYHPSSGTYFLRVHYPEGTDFFDVEVSGSSVRVSRRSNSSSSSSQPSTTSTSNVDTSGGTHYFINSFGGGSISRSGSIGGDNVYSILRTLPSGIYTVRIMGGTVPGGLRLYRVRIL